MDFTNKVVIVTGSSSGIGESTALLFANLSAKVVIVGRNEEKLKNVSKKVQDAKGIKPLVVKADLTQDSDVEKLVEETVRHFGQIDILVNNAGVGCVARITDGIQHFDKMISTNLRSVYLLTSIAVPYLIKTKGNIVNVSSIAAVKLVPDFLPYCISKAGLDALTKNIAKDLAAYGIRVNSVNPGPVRTDFQEAAGMNAGQIQDFVDSRLKRSVLGKLTRSEDVAELIVFLASDKAVSITGCIHFVDSGDLLA